MGERLCRQVLRGELKHVTPPVLQSVVQVVVKKGCGGLGEI